MAGKTTSEALSAYWREQIDAWSTSGQNQHAFCRQHDLSYHRFVYWRRRFEARSAAHRRPSALVPVVYQPSSSGHGLSLVLPSGVELRGIASDNLPLVQQLLSRLA